MKKVLSILLSLLLLTTSFCEDNSFVIIADDNQTTVVEEDNTAKDNNVLEESTTVDQSAIEQETNAETQQKDETEKYFLDDYKIIDNIKISVSGTFTEQVFLSVKKVYLQETLSDNNVVDSYTFDIKVLNQYGQEIQPVEPIKVSFEFAQIDNNLDVEVYHEETALDSVVEENTVTVESDGFSLYTVEFTYKNKQYVLEGDSYVRLDEILSAVSLSGNIESYEVSNSTLFNIFKGDEDGIEYVETYDDNGNILEYYPIDKENGNVLYMVSLQPFTSEEWLKVTIDGIKYTIVVTDAIRVDENGNQVGTSVRFMQESTTIGTITDSRVIQGPLEDNFTGSMPLAEIYIDDTLVNQKLWKNDDPDDPDNGGLENGVDVIAKLLVNETQDNGKYKAFTLNLNTDPNPSVGLGQMINSYGALTYDFSKRYLNDTQTLTVTGTNANNYELFPGDIVEYTLKGMATKYDTVSSSYKDYDVIITYSDILITMCQSSGTGSVNQSTIASGNHMSLMDTNAVYVAWSNGTGPYRLGLQYSVNVKVVDPDTGALISGSYYYPMTDIDIGRTGVGGFANLYNAANVNRYSEQVALMSNYGRPTASGSWEQKVWIPGGNYSASPFTNKANVTENNYPYTCNITSKTIDGQANTLLISPGGTTTAVSGKITTASGVNKDNTFYSGFITLANNTAGGINVKGWGSAPTSGGVESYVLTGSKIVNHKVDASSDVGGTIFTTTTGNSDGKLSGGTLLGRDAVNQPFELSAATGQSVTYTMTPKGGYILKGVYVKDGDIDIMTIVNSAKATVSESTYDTDGDGELDETEKAAYEAAVQQAINTALSNDSATSEISISSLTSLGKGVYAYTFNGITEDKSIHIEWEKTDLTVTKKISPSTQTTTDKFKFQIKLSDTTTEDTTWRVRAKKDTELFSYNPNIENGTPYYMAYYESHNETVPYKYVIVEDTTDKNPYEEGWYYYADGAYYLTTDTEPKEDVTYYIKDDTQTSTVTNYYYHILGWNEENETWDEKVIQASNNIANGSILGTQRIEDELSDNYLFIYDGTYVYNKASYDSETQTSDKHLFWAYDQTLSKHFLVVGNMETHPVGFDFDPNSSDGYIYVYDEIEGYSNKVVRTSTYYTDIEDKTYVINFGSEKYESTQDTNTPIYYNLISNPNGYTLDSGYAEVEGESGVYIVTLPAGQSPKTDDLTADGWDVTASRVGTIPDSFDLNAAMVAAGAKTVHGAVNTYEFELGVDETIDFNGVVPMGYNYEITEILPANSKWELINKTPNSKVNDFDGKEDVTFINKEKRYDITIKKNTVGNKAGVFGFTIEIYREDVTPGQKQSITIQAYKNSSDTNPTYVLSNSGAPIDITMNGKTATIASGEYTYGSGGQLDQIIDDLLTLNNSSSSPITMNNEQGEVKTDISTSIADQVQALIDEGYNSFSFEPQEFKLSTPDIINKVPYDPDVVPSGFSGSNGVFTFDLANNRSKIFTDAPFAYKYEIKETTLPAGWMNISKTNEAGTLTADVISVWENDMPEYDLTVRKETVDNETGNFEFKIKAWRDRPETTDEYIKRTEAYAVYDSSDNSLKFFRDEKQKYTNGQVDGTKTYYAGYETSYYTSANDRPWNNLRSSATSIVFEDPIRPQQTAYWFYGFNYVTSFSGLDKLDTSLVTDMKWMFAGVAGRFSPTLNTLDVSRFDTSNVTNMYGMFTGTESLTSLDVSHFDTSKISDMSMMFTDSYNINATINIMKVPDRPLPGYFIDAAKDSGELKVNYISPVTSDDIDVMLSTKADGNVVNGGEGRFSSPDLPTGADPSKLKTITDKLDLSAQLGQPDAKGYYTFNLSNGEDKVIENIPLGYQYEIIETAQDEWELVSKTNDKSTIKADTTSVFTNKLKKYDLTVEKDTVNNLSGTFNFEIKIWKDGKASTPSTESAVTAFNVEMAGGFENNTTDYTQQMNGLLPTERSVTYDPNGTNSISINHYSNIFKASGIYKVTAEGTKGSDWFYVVVPADANRSGTINAADMTAINSYLTGDSQLSDDFDLPLFDMNGDGTVNASDLLLINNILSGQADSSSPTYAEPTYSSAVTAKYVEISDAGSYSKHSDGHPIIWMANSRNSSTTVSFSVYDENPVYLDLHEIQGMTPKTDENNDGIADDGIYKFQLKNSEFITVPEIIHGYNYEVYEVDSAGNKVLVNSNIGDSDWKLISQYGNNTGTLTKDEIVTFVNKRVHDLTVKKETVDNVPGLFEYKIRLKYKTEEAEQDDPASASITVTQEFKQWNQAVFDLVPYDFDTDVSKYTWKDPFNYVLYKKVSDEWQQYKTSTDFMSDDWTYNADEHKWTYSFDVDDADAEYKVVCPDSDCHFTMEGWLVDGLVLSNSPSNEALVNDGKVSFINEIEIEGVIALDDQNDLLSLDIYKVYADEVNVPELTRVDGTSYPITSKTVETDSVTFEADGKVYKIDAFSVTINDKPQALLSLEFANNKFELSDGTSYEYNLTDDQLKITPNEYTFKLESGQSITIEDILHGTEYEIYEYKDDEWTLIRINDDPTKITVNEGAGGTKGTLETDEELVFLNKPTESDLTIKKVVSGNMGNKFKGFTFEARVGGWKTVLIDVINSSEHITQNIAKFTNDHTNDIESLRDILGRLPKLRILVNNTIEDDVGSDDLEGLVYRNGIIANYNSSTVFAPGYVMFGSGSNMEHFDFQPGDIFELQYYDYLDLSAYGGIPKIDENHDGIADDGWYVFTLSHNDYFEIADIPYGYSYEVSEADYSSEGYSTYVTSTDTSKTIIDNEEIRTVEDILKDDTTVEYTNKNHSVVPTKASMGTLIPIFILMLVGEMMLILKYLMSKRPKEEDE